MHLPSIFATQIHPQRVYTVGNVTFRMIELPGLEEFEIGNNVGEEDSYNSEHFKHSRVIRPFSMAEFPVTQKLWKEVVRQGQLQDLLKGPALSLIPSYFQGAGRPVEQVSWRDAREFCCVLNLLLNKPTDYFRLPSEAEWEYAARAGTRKHLYAGSNQLTEVGWHDKINQKESMSVGLLSPNHFGLYDMSGNVWEWCEDDWHQDYSYHPPDGQAWFVGSGKRTGLRMRRGGSWDDLAKGCRSANRFCNGPDDCYNLIGFRLAANALGLD